MESEDHNFILTEPPLNPPENREAAAEIMFETFNVPGLCIGVQAVLSLYAAFAVANKGGKVGTPSVFILNWTLYLSCAICSTQKLDISDHNFVLYAVPASLLDWLCDRHRRRLHAHHSCVGWLCDRERHQVYSHCWTGSHNPGAATHEVSYSAFCIQSPANLFVWEPV